MIGADYAATRTDDAKLKGSVARCRSDVVLERGSILGYHRAMTATASYTNRIARIRIELEHFEPRIWRRVEVPLTTSLRGLHDLIQAVFPFENYHLFQFRVGGDEEPRRYGVPNIDGIDWVKIYDARNLKIGTLVDRSVVEFAYNYDFGDNWEFKVDVEEVSVLDPARDYPRFIDGEHRAPPEDVGGITGFEEFLDAMAKPRSRNHHRMVAWYGSVFDLNDLDKGTIAKGVEMLVRRRAVGKSSYAKSRGEI